MVERKLGELDLSRLVRRQKLRPRQSLWPRIQPQRVTHVRYDHDALDRRKPGDDACQSLEAVMHLAAVDVAVSAKENFRFDLAEPIEHSPHTEIRGRRRPNRAHTCGRKHGDDGLGHIRQIAGDAISWLDAGVCKSLYAT